MAWLPIPELLPAAAALRALGVWSLDAPIRRFDACDWWYRLEFDSPVASGIGRFILGFDGLATIARVWLNGEQLLASKNMFLAHECDISSLLRPSGNVLLMRFCGLDFQLRKRRQRPRWRAPMVENQQLRWFRSTLLGRTPGWSPPAAIVGPWKPIWIEQRSEAEIETLSLQTELCGGTGLTHCHVRLLAPVGCTIESVSLSLRRQSQDWRKKLDFAEGVYGGSIAIEDVLPWWPHTHGESALYCASLLVRIANVHEDVVIDLRRVGFRTIHLDTHSGDFSLNINGVPIFCRGACWTPLDIVTLRSPASECVATLRQIRDAGMNMIRVAGTMVYEEAPFFDACDELGILVWQDFMLANMDYPICDAEFSSSLAAEAAQQLQQLQARPCLAVLCGGSEVEQQAAIWGAPRELWSTPQIDQLLGALCASIVPGVPFWPSSAHGGAYPHQANEGTTSYYGVGAYMRGLDDARRSAPKFATECLAFANVPAEDAIRRMPGGLAIKAHHAAWKARSPRDLGAGWDFDDVRDHYLALIFGVDPVKLRYADHDRYLTLSRAATGETMAAAFAEWRRPGSGCRGAIVLFLRDLWAGAGWGLLDDEGKPKACFHYLKRVLQPVTVLLSDESANGVYVHIVNDSEQRKAMTLDLACWQAGDILVARGEKEIDIIGHSARSFSCVELLGQFLDLNHFHKFGTPPCDVVVATLRNGEMEDVAQAFYFPMGMALPMDSDVGLSTEVLQVDPLTVDVTVHARRVAMGVHFLVQGFVAEDEFFHLAPDAQRTVRFRAKESSTFFGQVHAINSKVYASMTINHTAV
jgi:beta-mannosidase